MKYLNLYNTFHIKLLCRRHGIENYTINSDGTLDVMGNVDLASREALYSDKFFESGLKKLPLKFNYVSGNFDCHVNKLTSLEGSPKEVGGNFNCCYNQLITLEGAPKEVGGFFDCSFNQLITLEGAPRKVGVFCCDNNQLISLYGAPELASARIRVKGGIFNCEKNPLPSLFKKMIYSKYFKEIIKWQNDYNIWKKDGLDKFRFEEMMIDIKEELKEELDK